MTMSIETDLKEILGKIDARLDRMDQRLGNLETGLARVEEKVSNIDSRLEKLEDSQNKQVWTLIGIIGTVVIGAVIRYVLVSLPVT